MTGTGLPEALYNFTITTDQGDFWFESTMPGTTQPRNCCYVILLIIMHNVVEGTLHVPTKNVSCLLSDSGSADHMGHCSNPLMVVSSVPVSDSVSDTLPSMHIEPKIKYASGELSLELYL